LRRGDIVLVDDGNSEYAMKRIIGLPGETVQFWRGYVFINCRMLREPYLAKYTYTFPGGERADTFKVMLGQEQYYLMGDNRTCSVDSRHYGAVERTQIKRCVPRSESVAQARFLAYTLPVEGKRTIRPMEAN